MSNIVVLIGALLLESCSCLVLAAQKLPCTSRLARTGNLYQVLAQATKKKCMKVVKQPIYTFK